MSEEIDLVWGGKCPHCGKTHEWHYHRDGRTICEDGTIVCAHYPYNCITKKDLERLRREGKIPPASSEVSA